MENNPSWPEIEAEAIKAQAIADLEGGHMVDYFMPTETEDAAIAAIRDRIPTGWGRWISVQPGWYPIIVKLDQDIAKIAPDYEVHQVKEKFGGLRYYCSLDGRHDVETLISEAEKQAAITCESCGQAAVLKVSRTGWWKTICDACDPDGEFTPVGSDDED